MNAAWQAVETELDRARDVGRTVRVWLRDDDAVTVTSGLEELRELCSAFALPVLLAVIPAGVAADLGTWIAHTPSFTPCQHGFSHANHAATGQRACELGGGRPLRVILDDLMRGRRILQATFAGRLSNILVPPWNRIDPAVPALLPDLGFEALSTFGPPPAETQSIVRLNADLDIIDWRQGRVGRSTPEVGAQAGRTRRDLAPERAPDRDSHPSSRP